jgi:hypothetical protein
MFRDRKRIGPSDAIIAFQVSLKREGRSRHVYSAFLPIDDER